MLLRVRSSDVFRCLGASGSSIGKPIEKADFCILFQIFWGLGPGFVSWVLGIVCWVLGFVFWVLGFVFWVSGFVFWVSGIVFWVSGIVFWVSGFVFWMSGLVFWVSDIVSVPAIRQRSE